MHLLPEFHVGYKSDDNSSFYVVQVYGVLHKWSFGSNKVVPTQVYLAPAIVVVPLTKQLM